MSLRFGVTYRLNTPVKGIITNGSDNSISGVALADGSTIPASTVVCNADLVYAYNNLLPPSSYAKSLSARPASCSSFSFYWALDTKIPELHTHNIFLAKKYKESFDEIFHDQSLPSEPSFYVNVPSRVDPTAAPPNKDTVVVLCPVGHLLAKEASTPGSFFTWGRQRGLTAENQAEWDRLISRARNAVIETIEVRLGIVLRDHIIHEDVNTPSTWKSKFNLDKGAILGLSHSFFNVLSFRPATKHASIKGLYFCGASTHPGTGVPIVLAGSRVVADQVLDDLKRAEKTKEGKLKYQKPWGEWNAWAYATFGASWRGRTNKSVLKLDKGEKRSGRRGAENPLDIMRGTTLWGWPFSVFLAILLAFIAKELLHR